MFSEVHQKLLPRLSLPEEYVEAPGQMIWGVMNGFW